MKKVLALVILGFISFQCFGQGFNWEWARSSSGTPLDSFGEVGGSVASNPIAGVYLTGSIQADTAVFNSDTVTGILNTYIYFLARYDGNGRLKWIQTPKNYVNLGVCKGVAVATDEVGNAYLTGDFSSDSLYFGNICLHAAINPAVATSVFTAKFDTGGHVLWANKIDNAISYAVAADISGYLYVTGTYDGDSLVIGDTVLRNPGATAFFLTKYDSIGNVVWAQCAGGQSGAYAQAITTDNAGNIYITGATLSNSFMIGDTVISTPGPAIFAAKFNAAGYLLWINVSNHMQQHNIYLGGIAVDLMGNVIITGAYYPSITFDSVTLYTNNIAYNLFIAKFSPAGQLIWAKAPESSSSIYGVAVTTDMDSNIYVTAGGVALGPDTVAFDSVITIQNANVPLYLVKLSPSGSVTKAQLFGSGGSILNSVSSQNSVSIDRTGNGYIAGVYGDGNCACQMVVGNDTLAWSGGFVAKFKADSLVCNLAQPILTSSANAICINDSAHICASLNFTSYNWNSGQTTPCINATQSGYYLVTVTDQNYCTAVSNSLELLIDTPAQISILTNHDTLSTNYGIGIQWFLNGAPIPGDTTNQIIATKAGQYTVQITDSNGCTALSNPVTITSINNVTENAITIYPNPSVGNWQLAVSNDLIDASFQIWDEAGQVIYQSKITSTSSNIQLTGVAGGIYFLKINTPEGLVVRKLVKL
jgi:hypothetical protein